MNEVVCAAESRARQQYSPVAMLHWLFSLFRVGFCIYASLVIDCSSRLAGGTCVMVPPLAAQSDVQRKPHCVWRGHSGGGVGRGREHQCVLVCLCYVSPPTVSHSGEGRRCECGGGWRQRAPAAAALSSLSPPTHSLWGRAALWALGAYIWTGENRVFAPALMPQGQTRHGSPIPNAYHGPEGSGCAVERDLGSHKSSSSLF